MITTRFAKNCFWAGTGCCNICTQHAWLLRPRLYFAITGLIPCKHKTY